MQAQDRKEADALTAVRERLYSMTTASRNTPQELFACLCMAILHDCWPSAAEKVFSHLQPVPMTLRVAESTNGNQRRKAELCSNIFVMRLVSSA